MGVIGVAGTIQSCSIGQRLRAPMLREVTLKVTLPQLGGTLVSVTLLHHGLLGK